MSIYPKEVENFYTYLENINSLNTWDILLNLKHTDPIEGQAEQNLITERKVLNLNFNDGRLLSNVQLSDSTGNIDSSIHLNSTEIDYLKLRLSESNNLFVKGRYANIIWQETKNNSYALTTINLYIELLRTFTIDDLNDTLPFLEAIIYISQTTKSNTDEVKTFILFYLNSTQNWFKHQIVDLILKSKLFTKKDLEIISSDILNWLYSDNYFLNKYILETALGLFKKIGKPNSEVYNLLANNEDIILSNHPDETSFIRATSTYDKADYYKKAKNIEEYKKTILEYNRLKHKTKFHKISVELDDEEIKHVNDILNKCSKQILKYSSEEILTLFASDETILVNPKTINSNSNNKSNINFRDILNISAFDINRNFKKLNNKEKSNQQNTNEYTIAHNTMFYMLFLKVFINGAIQGKLNYHKIYNFFDKYSWYGKEVGHNFEGENKNYSYTWLSMLSPGLHSLFSQFELAAFLNTNKINNYILAIDSLTIKFEGALRDFISLNGGNTTVEKKGSIQEQLLEELIDNPKSLQLFSNREIKLFKYTFTRNGLNIRNNVAHCFFKYPHYTLQNAALVFFCILRLGQYSVSLNEQSGK